MKTFGLWMLLFLAISLFLGTALTDWGHQDLLIESTLLSYIMYKLIKDEIK